MELPKSHYSLNLGRGWVLLQQRRPSLYETSRPIVTLPRITNVKRRPEPRQKRTSFGVLESRTRLHDDVSRTSCYRRFGRIGAMSYLLKTYETSRSIVLRSMDRVTIDGSFYVIQKNTLLTRLATTLL